VQPLVAPRAGPREDAVGAEALHLASEAGPSGLSWCQAASTRSLLTWALPALVIAPRLTDSPDEDSEGTSPT
jgi:hypothetical protein